MILKALTLENFKGILEPVHIEFAPLTLLFGRNNAGKSTIVQALMYAREVLERNNCDAGGPRWAAMLLTWVLSTTLSMRMTAAASSACVLSAIYAKSSGGTSPIG